MGELANEQMNIVRVFKFSATITTQICPALSGNAKLIIIFRTRHRNRRPPFALGHKSCTIGYGLWTVDWRQSRHRHYFTKLQLVRKDNCYLLSLQLKPNFLKQC